jgi:hypothetical protein
MKKILLKMENLDEQSLICNRASGGFSVCHCVLCIEVSHSFIGYNEFFPYDKALEALIPHSFYLCVCMVLFMVLWDCITLNRIINE